MLLFEAKITINYIYFMYRIIPLLFLIPLSIHSQSFDYLGRGIASAVFSDSHPNGIGAFGVQLGNLYNQANLPALRAGNFPLSSADSLVAPGWSTASLNHFIIQYNPFASNNQLSVRFEVDEMFYELQSDIPFPECITAIQFGINNVENALYSINNLKLDGNLLVANPLFLTPDTSTFYKITGSDISKGFLLEMDVVINQTTAANRSEAAILLSFGQDQADELPLNDNNTSLVATRSDGGTVSSFCEGQTLTYTATGGTLYRFFTYEEGLQTGQISNINYLGDFSAINSIQTNELVNGQQIGVDISDGICIHQKLLGYFPIIFPIPTITDLTTTALNICVPEPDVESRSWVLPALSEDEIYIYEAVAIPPLSNLEISSEYYPGFTQTNELTINSDGSVMEWTLNPSNLNGQPIFGTYTFRVLIENQTTSCRSIWSENFTIQLSQKPTLFTPLTIPKVCHNQLLLGTYSEANQPIYAGISPFASWNIWSVNPQEGLQSAATNLNLTTPQLSQSTYIIGNDRYLNTTNQNKTVQYSISANGQNGCTSEAVNVEYSILAQPVIQPMTDTSILSGQLLQKTLHVQDNFIPPTTFELLDRKHLSSLLPQTFNTQVGETGGAALIAEDQWMNTTISSKEVQYTIGVTNSDLNGVCPMTTESFTLTVVPQPSLSWKELTSNMVNPSDTLIYCADHQNTDIQYFLLPDTRINEGEEMFLVQTGITIEDPDNLGLQSNQFGIQPDTLAISNSSFYRQLIEDQWTLTQPASTGVAYLTYQWKYLIKTIDGTILESPVIPITYGITTTQLEIGIASLNPVAGNSSICQNESVELEISVIDDGRLAIGTDYNLVLSSVYHSLDSASGIWEAGYGPVTGSQNYQSNQILNTSSTISEVLSHSLTQTVWIRYDLATQTINSNFACAGSQASAIISVAPNLQASVQWTNNAPNSSYLSAADLPYSLNLNFINNTELSLREKLLVSLLGSSESGGSYIDNSLNSTALLSDTLLKDTNQLDSLTNNLTLSYWDQLSLSNPTQFYQPSSIGYRWAYQWKGARTCSPDTLQQVFTVLPTPELIILNGNGLTVNTPFQVCSGSEATFQISHTTDFTALSSSYYQLVLTDIAYSDANSAGTWRPGYGPVQVTQPLSKGHSVELNQLYTQSFTHSASKVYYIRYRFTNFIEGFTGLREVGSTQVIIQVNPNPTFQETYDNLSKNTSADGLGNCSAPFSWNHPQIFGGTGTETLTLTINSASGNTVTPGAAYSDFFGPGIHQIYYTVSSPCGASDQINFTVTVEDNEAPSISCPNDVDIVLGSGQIFAEVQYDLPLVTDNCQGTELLRIRGPLPGDLFPEGTYSTTFMGFDQVGRIAICHFEVNILPASASPPLRCADQTYTIILEEGTCEAPVNFLPPNCEGDCQGATLQKTSALSSGQVLPAGTHEVHYTLQHRSGAQTECTINLVVEPPVARDFTCSSPTLSIPYGETYQLKLTDFIQPELLMDACGKNPSAITLSQSEIDCEESFVNRPISIEWKNGFGQKESCKTSLTVERSGNNTSPDWNTIFQNDLKNAFVEEPCNSSMPYQIAVTCAVYSQPATGLAYTDLCSGTFLEASIREISNFGRGGLQIRESEQATAPEFTIYLEKSFEGVRLVQRIKASINRKDGKGEQILWVKDGKLPIRFRIGVLDGKVLGYYSEDGSTWNLMAERSFSSANCLIGGLYVLSNHTRQEVKVGFSQLAWTTSNSTGQATSNQNMATLNSHLTYTTPYQMSIFPNPAQEKITINGPEPIQEILITDLSGRKIYYRDFGPSSLKSTQTIYTKDFTEGVLLVSVKDVKGRIAVQKLIVQGE